MATFYNCWGWRWCGLAEPAKSKSAWTAHRHLAVSTASALALAAAHGGDWPSRQLHRHLEGEGQEAHD